MYPYFKKTLKKRNNEIITQYLTGSTMVEDESPVVGVSMNVKMTQMSKSKISQVGRSVLKSKQL
jgi:hypothetical protein